MEAKNIEYRIKENKRFHENNEGKVNDWKETKLLEEKDQDFDNFAA